MLALEGCAIKSGVRTNSARANYLPLCAPNLLCADSRRDCAGENGPPSLRQPSVLQPGAFVRGHE